MFALSYGAIMSIRGGAMSAIASPSDFFYLTVVTLGPPVISSSVPSVRPLLSEVGADSIEFFFVFLSSMVGV